MARRRTRAPRPRSCSSRHDQLQTVEGLDADGVAGVGAGITMRIPELAMDMDSAVRATGLNDLRSLADQAFRPGRLLRPRVQVARPTAQQDDLHDLQDTRDRE